MRNLFPPYPLDACPAKAFLLVNKAGNNDKNATDGWENVADSRLYTRWVRGDERERRGKQRNRSTETDKNATDGWENVADSRLYTR